MVFNETSERQSLPWKRVLTFVKKRENEKEEKTKKKEHREETGESPASQFQSDQLIGHLSV